jgi:hypothetical protein
LKKKMITEIEKTNCAESIAFGLNRAEKWRRKTDVRYPGDPRNLRAAATLAKLATESVQLTDAEWDQLRPYYSYCGVDARWREALAQAARQIGFYQHINSFPYFVKSLVEVLSQSSIAA